MSVKLFGKYHDINILLLSFILTTIVGSFLTNYWQNKSADIARETLQISTEIEISTKIFENISTLMDKRLYRMRRINMGYGQSVVPKDMHKRWDSYREILFEWNDSLNKNLALIEIYFGEKSRFILETKIQKKFIIFGRMLESANAKLTNDEHDKRLKLADDLNNDIYTFDLELIHKIQLGHVGTHQ